MCRATPTRFPFMFALELAKDSQNPTSEQFSTLYQSVHSGDPPGNFRSANGHPGHSGVVVSGTRTTLTPALCIHVRPTPTRFPFMFALELAKNPQNPFSEPFSTLCQSVHSGDPLDTSGRQPTLSALGSGRFQRPDSPNSHPVHSCSTP